MHSVGVRTFGYVRSGHRGEQDSMDLGVGIDQEAFDQKTLESLGIVGKILSIRLFTLDISST